MALANAMIAFRGGRNPWEVEAPRRMALAICLKMARNVVNAPNEEKFRSVSVHNEAFKNKVLSVLGRESAEVILGALGFDAMDDAFICSKSDADIQPNLTALQAEVDRTPFAKTSSNPTTKSIVTTKAARAQRRLEQQRSEQDKNATAQRDQLSELRRQRGQNYQEAVDYALARRLQYGDQLEDRIDNIALLNQQFHSFISCHGCGQSLRYPGTTISQYVLCPCGEVMEISNGGDPNLPVEPGEPVAEQARQTYGGPVVQVRCDGRMVRIPLHQLLMMLRRADETKAEGAEKREIDALPTQEFVSYAPQAQDKHCQICMEDFESGDAVKTLPCFHLFHGACVDQWLAINKVCPTCRFEIC
eukprot:GEMP01039746.1.p1 GENE.GEMP01039746.1~~GEMP01039746.1.p1  ORF type:complete len:360 (+),score=67.33 GEMP01039746.1:34-1113(+)